MRINVGVSDFQFSTSTEDTLITHGLGSCLGVAAYDPILKIGAMLHYMLPIATGDRSAQVDFNPYMFGNTGLELMLQFFDLQGSQRKNIRFVIAGGASINSIVDKIDHFEIGKRNITVAKKFFWSNNILIGSEHVAGNLSRTLYLELSSGKTFITSQGNKIDL